MIYLTIQDEVVICEFLRENKTAMETEAKYLRMIGNVLQSLREEVNIEIKVSLVIFHLSPQY